jgi:hypothetical protein
MVITDELLEFRHVKCCMEIDVNLTKNSMQNVYQNKEKLPDQWKEYIIVPVHKKGDNTYCSNYCDISLLSTS